MYQLQAQNFGLYVAILFGGFTLIFAALGPGIFNSQPNPFSWQYLFFEVLCHQDSLRSFHINNQPMAVCARCFGIYTAFLFGWLFLPVFGWLGSASQQKKKIFLIAAILLNSTDVIGNYFSIWSNTLHSRFLLGSLVGLAVTFFLAESFFNKIKSEY
ncbi:MAG: DUF2085 domain-containing protein [Balneolaceae bacterium]